MSLDVKLQVFEGPLDLLLHLIEKNKIDIYDIPIVEVTEQYLEYVRRLEHEDLELTSEFMLMAATLIDIKCRMLLPSDSSVEEEEEDPREELVQQLIAYKEYKAKAGLLRERMEDTGELVSRSCDIPQEIKSFRPPVDTAELLEGVSLDRLHEIFSFVLRRQEEKVDPIRSKFGVIEKEQISFPDKLDYVEICARRKRRISFRRL
ncbi:MAG: segregation/condensation protein A, partial [Eubacterium sp.]|nr:segregation/condensation protein A [Eubacterium sp.]